MSRYVSTLDSHSSAVFLFPLNSSSIFRPRGSSLRGVSSTLYLLSLGDGLLGGRGALRQLRGSMGVRRVVDQLLLCGGGGGEGSRVLEKREGAATDRLEGCVEETGTSMSLPFSFRIAKIAMTSFLTSFLKFSSNCFNLYCKSSTIAVSFFLSCSKLWQCFLTSSRSKCNM